MKMPSTLSQNQGNKGWTFDFNNLSKSDCCAAVPIKVLQITEFRVKIWTGLGKKRALTLPHKPNNYKFK